VTTRATDSQDHAPLAESIFAHLDRRRTRFHIPGHKAGRGAFSELAACLGNRFWEVDLTEVADLDDLHKPAPGGPLDRAQDLAARAYGARQARFLVGGATSGVLAMVLAAVGPGGNLAVTAPFHRSVAAAAVLAGCSLTVIPPRLAGLGSLPVPESPEVVARTLEEPQSSPGGGGRPRALLVTSPTYHGVTADLRAAAALCRRAGIPLLVDAAHGAHFGFAPGLPPSPPGQGVDACVVSLHKTAGALTPGAVLLVGSAACAESDGRGPRLDIDRLDAVLRLVQTSSPPFPVLASLDMARRRLATRGAGDWSQTIELARHTRESLDREAPGLFASFPGQAQEGSAAPVVSGPIYDPTRIVFELAPAAAVQLTGLGLARTAADLGVDLEMAGWSEVVAVATPADSAEDHRRLVRALASAVADGAPTGAGRPSGFGGREGSGPRRDSAVSMAKQCWEAEIACSVPPCEAFRSRRRRVPVARGAGCVVSDVVCPYPPGVPLLVPGQRITEPVARYLDFLVGAGLRVHGVTDSHVEVMA